MMLLNKFNNLDKRQKTLIGLLGVAIIVLIWQMCSLFTGSSVPVKVAAPHSIVDKRVSSNGGDLGVGKAAAQVVAAGATAAVDPATNSQAEYLRLVNEYQMAQLQRMIAEDNEAIAVAKRNAAQAMSDTVGMAGGSLGSEDNGDNSQAAANVYSLVYTGQQNDGQWTATLKKDGQSFDVVPGRQLSDGAQVMSIDENGVLLNQANNAGKLLVTFSGVTQVENKANPQANNISPVKPVVVEKPAAKVVAEPVKAAALVKPAPVVAAVKIVPPVPAVKKVVAKPLLTTSQQKELKLPTVPEVTKLAAVKSTTVVKPVVKTVADAQANTNAYTIQLTTDRELASVQGFITDHKLQDKATYVHAKTEHGGDLYIGIYGQYATRTEAQQALETLPASVRSEGAYVVASNSIHAIAK